MSTRAITHPPLPDHELKRIAARHTSPDAILLLREIERLKQLEGRFPQLISLVRAANYTYAANLADIAQEIADGRIGHGRFALDAEPERQPPLL